MLEQSVTLMGCIIGCQGKFDLCCMQGTCA